MMNGRLLGGLGSAVVAFAIAGNGLVLKGSPALPPPEKEAAPPLYRGAGSCSATACHGDDRPSGAKVLRNEHSTWIQHDRHADAFAVLLEDRSKSIAANLSGGAIPADRDPRCLACHSTPRRTPVPPQSPALLREGVGCEACHGPADRWIGPHTRWDWAARPPEDKERFGMTPTADLARRAKVCDGCHVGEPSRDGLPARDVDHEMIAAGHPRLNFEFSAYLSTMSRHWRDDAGPDSTADFPVRAWSIGQVTSARSALVLLRDRAVRSRPGTGGDRPAEWPEFSEYACFSCHHDLRDDRWRRRGPVAVGLPRWGSWSFAMLEPLASVGPAADGRALSDGLGAIRFAMARPRPDPADVILAVDRVGDLLDRRLKATSNRNPDATEVEAILAAVASFPARGEVEGWDQATQRYLALVPLHQSLRSMAPGRSNPQLADELAKLRDALRFPDGSDSPKSFDPARLPRPGTAPRPTRD